MYSNTTTLAPQVTYAKKPVPAVSIHKQMNFVAPIAKRFKGTQGKGVTYVPA